MGILNTLLAVVFGLMIVTNILVEVIKKVTWDKIPTNLLAVIVAEVLTMIFGIVYSQINSITISWYHVVGAIIIGLFVSYAAMFGFDKLRQALEQIDILKDKDKDK